jgi:ATP-binding cassette subfamily B multidrug efflux pump
VQPICHPCPLRSTQNMSSQKPSNRHSLATLLPTFRPYRTAIVAGLLLIVVTNVFQVLSPAILGNAIDAVAGAASRSEILQYGGLLVLFAMLAGVARYAHRKLLNGTSRRIEMDLRVALFDHLLRMDAPFFARHRTGDLMTRAVSDIGAVRQAVGPAIMYSVNTLTLTALSLTYMLRISPRLTLFSLIPMLLMAPVTLFFGNLIHRRWARIQDQLEVLTTVVQENLNGVRIVRAYVQEGAQEAHFDDVSREYIDRNLSLARVSAVFDPALGLLTAAGLLIVLMLGSRLVMQGQLTIGQLVAFNTYLVMLIWPMIAIGWVTNLFQRGAASYQRLQDVMNVQPLVATPSSPVDVDIRGALEFRNVTFRYPDTDRVVLHDVSFTIAAGQTAAFVGPTGSGKSTIVSLLTRRYDPTSGSVLLDQASLPTVALEQLRAAIALVPQDAFVFSETIAENIALGLPGGTDAGEQIERVAQIARLDEAVADFPMGYQTRLGERGVNLSGGQRQRTTLARALARDPRVLILDDALSAVDTHTETEILEALQRVFAQRTAIIVSHRVTAVMHADIIFVVEDGRIVEQGSHSELLTKRGLYASLLRRQLLEEELDDVSVARQTANL